MGTENRVKGYAQLFSGFSPCSQSVGTAGCLAPSPLSVRICTALDAMEDDETRHPSIARRPALSEHATAFCVRTPRRHPVDCSHTRPQGRAQAGAPVRWRVRSDPRPNRLPALNDHSPDAPARRDASWIGEIPPSSKPTPPLSISPCFNTSSVRSSWWAGGALLTVLKGAADNGGPALRRSRLGSSEPAARSRTASPYV